MLVWRVAPRVSWVSWCGALGELVAPVSGGPGLDCDTPRAPDPSGLAGAARRRTHAVGDT